MTRRGRTVRVIPNVVLLSDQKYMLRRSLSPKFLWMRSFHPIYNPAMAVEIFAKVKARRQYATLVMAGVDKGLESEMKDLVASLGLQDSVRFPGFLDAAAKAREFSEADIYLNTNTVDNMPVSVVEACASGVPVVATNVGGLSHLITHEQDGLLVPNGDVDTAVDAVERLLSDQRLAERLSTNGRRLAERSDWPNVRKMWEALFDEVLNDRDQHSTRERSSLTLPGETA
jgi:glycosyltransferase involved in cell wall biosynthesis